MMLASHALADITVLYEKPDRLSYSSSIFIYYTDVVPAGALSDHAYPNGVVMTPDGAGWYSYSMPGVTSARVMFSSSDTDNTLSAKDDNNNNNNNQLPTPIEISINYGSILFVRQDNTITLTDPRTVKEGSLVNLGCYKDSEVIHDLSTNEGPLYTIEACARQAIFHSHTYFALKNGGICYTGNTYGSYGKAENEVECDRVCTSNPSQICGGESVISVFSFYESPIKAVEDESEADNFELFKEHHDQIKNFEASSSGAASSSSIFPDESSSSTGESSSSSSSSSKFSSSSDSSSSKFSSSSSSSSPSKSSSSSSSSSKFSSSSSSSSEYLLPETPKVSLTLKTYNTLMFLVEKGLNETAIGNLTKVDQDLEVVSFNTTEDDLAFTNLDGDTEYILVVYAVNNFGRSPPATMIVRTAIPPPPKPKGFKAIPQSPSSILLQWLPQDAFVYSYGITHYKLSNGFKTVQLDGSVSFYMDTNLNFTINYDYALIAVNEYGMSSPAYVSSAPLTPEAPSTPTGFKVKSATSTGVTLGWNQMTYSYDFKFRVYKDSKAVIELDSTTLYWVDSDVQSLQTVSYSISAFGEFGESKISELLKVFVPPPSVPELVLVQINSTRFAVTVEWSLQTIYAFDVNYHLALLPHHSDGEIQEVNTTSTTYTFTNLKEGAEFTLIITASNNYGDYKVLELLINTEYAPLPQTPMISVQPISAISFNVTWSSQADTSVEYSVELASGTATENSIWITIAVNLEVTSFLYKNALPSASYSVRVIAFNGVGNSTSMPAFINMPSLPGAPLLDEPSFISATSVALSWSAASSNSLEPVLSYRVQYGINNFDTSIEAASTSAKISGLLAGTTYSFRVIASSPSGLGSFSNVKTFTVPNPPSSVVNASAAMMNLTHIIITWAAPSSDSRTPIQSYLISEQCSTPSLFLANSYSVGGSSTTYVGRVSFNCVYSYRIQAISAAGTSSNSSEPLINAFYTPATPTAPSNIVGVIDNSGAILKLSLSWAASVSNMPALAPILSYTVTQLIAGGSDQVLYNGISNSTSITLKPGVYTLEVYSMNAVGSSSHTRYNATIPDSNRKPYFTSHSILSGSSVTLRWDLNVGTSSGSVTSITLTTGTQSVTLASNSNSYTWTGLESGQTYSFVVSYSIDSQSFVSEPIRLTMPSIPSTPTSLSVSLVGSIKVFVSWDVAPGVDVIYNLQQKVSGSSSWTTIYSGNSTSASIQGLQPSTIYQFQVSASTQAGSSAFSDFIEIMTYSLPTAPLLTSVVQDIDTLEVNVEWIPIFSDSSRFQAISYQVQAQINYDGSWTDFGLPTTNNNIHLHASLFLAGTLYNFRVYAISDAGVGPFSLNSQAIVTFDVPSTPVIRTAYALSATSIVVVASLPSSLLPLQFNQIDVANAATNVLISSNTIRQPSIVIQGLPPSTNLSITSKWNNTLGWSSPSVVVFVSTYAAPPSAPTITSATATSGRDITVVWSAPSSDGGASINSYLLEMAQNSDVLSFSTAYVGPNTNAVISLLLPNVKYAFRVSASNLRSGYGPTSAIVNATTQSILPSTPAAPIASGVTSSSLVLTWRAPYSYSSLPTLGFIIRSKTNGILYNVSNPTTLTLTISGLNPATSYTFNLAVFNSFGLSEYSSDRTVTTLATPPSGMSAPTLSSAHQTSLVVTWSPPANTGGIGISAYILRWSTAGGRLNYAFVTSGNSYTISSLSAATTYSISVAARNTQGDSEYSAALSAATLSVGPSILSLSASNPSNSGYKFSAGCVVTVTFNMATSGSGTLSQSQLDQMFEWSATDVESKAQYSGSWISSSELSITFSQTNSVTVAPIIGVSTITVLAAANLKDAAGTSAPSTATSPELSGSWGNPTKPEYVGAIIGYPSSISTLEGTSKDFPTLSFNNSLASSTSSFILNISAVYGTINDVLEFRINLASPSKLPQEKFTYMPNAYYAGNDLITFSLALATDSSTPVFLSTMIVNVAAVNHKPEVNVNGSINAGFGQWNSITSISISDVDVTNSSQLPYTVSILGSTGARFRFSGDVESVSFMPSYSSQSQAFVLNGPIAAVNSALKNLLYIPPTSSFLQFDKFTVSVNDNGAVGLGGALQTDKIISATISCTSSTAAPKLVSAQWQDSLSTILVTFDKPVYTIHRNSGNCAKYFDLAFYSSPDSLSSFLGKGSRCTWQDSTTLIVQLGASAFIIPNNLLILISNSIQTCPGSISASGNVSVAGPLNPPVPSFTLTIPKKLGSCDVGYISVQGSTGLGGRPGLFLWAGSLLSDGSSAVSNYDFVQGVSNGVVKSSTSYIQLLAMTLGKDTDYKVSITLVNMFGVSSVFMLSTIQISSLDLPALRIDGPTSMSIRASDSLKIKGVAAFSDCSTGANKRLIYSWTATANPALGTSFMNNIKTNGPILQIRKNTLTAGVKYVFTLAIYLQSNQQLNNTASVEVEVLNTPIVAKIKGGSMAQFSRSDSFNIDASSSSDPDDTAEPWSYSWTCITSSDTPCYNQSDPLQSLVQLPALSKFEIPAAVFAVNLYTFTVTVSKGSRSDTASVWRQIDAGIAPSVSIESAPSKVRFDDMIVISTKSKSRVEGSKYLAYDWKAFDGVSGEALPLLSQLGVVTNQPSLQLNGARKAVFTPFAQYLFVLTVTDSIGSTATVQANVGVRSVPSSGVMSVYPTTVTAFDDELILSTSDWVTDSAPLTFSYYYTIDINDSSLVDSSDMWDIKRLTLASRTTESSVRHTPRFNGLAANNYKVTFVLHVEDSVGCFYQLSTTITINQKQLPSGTETAFLGQQANSITSTLSSKADPDEAHSSISGLNKGLNQRRRPSSHHNGRLLATDPQLNDAKQLRSTMLSVLSQVASQVQPQNTLSSVADAISVPSESLLSHLDSATSIVNTALTTAISSQSMSSTLYPAITLIQSNAIDCLSSQSSSDSSFISTSNSVISSGNNAAMIMSKYVLTIDGETYSFPNPSYTYATLRSSASFALSMNAASSYSHSLIVNPSASVSVPIAFGSSVSNSFDLHAQYYPTISLLGSMSANVPSQYLNRGPAIISSLIDINGNAISSMAYHPYHGRLMATSQPVQVVMMPFNSTNCTYVSSCEPACAVYDGSWYVNDNIHVSTASFNYTSGQVLCNVYLANATLSVFEQIVIRPSSSSSSTAGASSSPSSSSSTGNTLSSSSSQTSSPSQSSSSSSPSQTSSSPSETTTTSSSSSSSQTSSPSQTSSFGQTSSSSGFTIPVNYVLMRLKLNMPLNQTSDTVYDALLSDLAAAVDQAVSIFISHNPKFDSDASGNVYVYVLIIPLTPDGKSAGAIVDSLASQVNQAGSKLSTGAFSSKISEITTLCSSGLIGCKGDVSQLPSQTSDSGSSSNIGAIVGGVIGGALGVSLIIALIWLFRRKNQGQNKQHSMDDIDLEAQVSDRVLIHRDDRSAGGVIQVQPPANQPYHQAQTQEQTHQAQADGQRFVVHH